MIVNPTDDRIIEYINNAEVAKRPRGNPGGKKRKYKDIIAAFDIETTTIRYRKNDVNFMYSWALQLDEEITIIGRTWEEFRILKDRIAEELNGLAIPVFVHNLKYEFQYLKFLDFQSDEVIASDRREVIKAYSDPFEFRCSYKLTGISLEKFTEHVEHKKLSGAEFDYNKIRYPWTKLSSAELAYIQNDVLGLVEAIRQRNEIYNDSIYSMPITLTGYIRRIVRNNLRSYNKSQREKIKIDEYIYKFIAGAFRGGNACANRYYIGEVVEGVYHLDVSSAYGSYMTYEKYPIADWQIVRNPDVDKLLKYIYIRKRAVIARVIFNNIRLNDVTDPAPYISATKCIVRGKSKQSNNRILAAEQIETYITDIDFDLIMDQYEYDSLEVVEMIKNRYGYLPPQLTEIIEGLYIKKTELKGVDPILWKKAKEQLNSVFGLTAQNPAKEKIIYQDGKFIIDDKGAQKCIDDHNKTAFVSYAWGCWTSLHGRAAMQKMIKAVGDDFIYCDTDGIYFTNYDKHKDAIEKIIRAGEIRAERSENVAVDADGVLHYLGAWEHQEPIKKFIAAGVKKYAWEDSSGLHIAVAGVHKEIGGAELGKIEAFKEGFQFIQGGGNDSIYYDDVSGEITIEGNKIKLTPYIIIKQRAYTLGIYQEYIDIFSTPKFISEYLADRGHNRNEYIFR